MIKSPLNYTGGKFKLLPQILPLFPDVNDINMFVDLFCGGGDVGINISKLGVKKVVCNDVLEPLMKLYTEFNVKEAGEIYKYIFDTISKNNLSRENKLEYMAFRKHYNETKIPLDFYILICHSFSNLIEFNFKMEYNVPFGKRTFNIKLQQRLKEFINICHNIKFSNKSFENINPKKLHKNDFVYVDPPYLITDVGYARNGFWTLDKDKQLLEKIDELHRNNIRFALSNVLYHKGKQNDLLIKWSEKYKVNYLDFNYSTCNYQTMGKDDSVEVLITNY